MENKNTIIALQDVHKHYASFKVLNGLSLGVYHGEIYGLLGPNGAGKSTALRIMCGLTNADKGEGHCLNTALGKTPQGIGYMPQRGGLYDDLSIEDNLLFFARAHHLNQPKQRVIEALEQHGLSERAQQLVMNLSGGWRQKVALAVALLHSPKLLLLDEPTAGLDPEARETLWLSLRQQSRKGVSIIVTTHYADEAERCDRISYIQQGKLRIEGPPNQISHDLGIQVQQATFKQSPPSPKHLKGEQVIAIPDATGWRVLTSTLNQTSTALDHWYQENQATVTTEKPRLSDALVWLSKEAAA